MFSGKRKRFTVTKPRPFNASRQRPSRFADEGDGTDSETPLALVEDRADPSAYSEPIGPQIPPGASITMPTSPTVVSHAPKPSSSPTDYLKMATSIVEAISGKKFTSSPPPYVAPKKSSFLSGSTMTYLLMGGAGLATVLILSSLASGSRTSAKRR